ncbi:DUF2721 domain-containing protein [Alsobacter sp. R-9]
MALEFLPPLERLTQIFANATAPAFFLGAVAAFVSLMTSRLAVVRDRAVKLQAAAQTKEKRIFIKQMKRLIRRARRLNDAIVLTLASGICATLLLTVLFMSQFLGEDHAYGAAVLFCTATLLLSAALYLFFDEARLARYESDEEVIAGIDAGMLDEG